MESLAARLAGSGGRARPRSNFGHLGAGHHALAPIRFTLLGEAYLTARQLAEARGAVESDHAAAAAQAGQPRFDAELVLASGRATAEDEALFRRAIEIGRAQEAKAFGLRAATGLARRRDGAARRAAVVARGVVRRLLPYARLAAHGRVLPPSPKTIPCPCGAWLGRKSRRRRFPGGVGADRSP